MYPIMPAAGPQNMQSDRSVLSRPSMDLVVWLLDSSISSASTLQADRLIGPRLAAALAACAQLSALPASQRMWSLQSLRKLMTLAASSSGALSLNISQMINSEGGGAGGVNSSAAASAAAINLSAGSAASPLSSGGVADASPSVGSSASETMRCVIHPHIQLLKPFFTMLGCMVSR